jgi:hypothetical protein
MLILPQVECIYLLEQQRNALLRLSQVRLDTTRHEHWLRFTALLGGVHQIITRLHTLLLQAAAVVALMAAVEVLAACYQEAAC